jgi:hypothetical protein
LGEGKRRKKKSEDRDSKIFHFLAGGRQRRDFIRLRGRESQLFSRGCGTGGLHLGFSVDEVRLRAAQRRQM